MSGHTPGPWHFLDWGGRIVDDSVGSSQVLIATVALNTRGDESRHNARLIAAAPDLADALFNLLAAVGELALVPAQRKRVLEACDAASAALIASGRVMG